MSCYQPVPFRLKQGTVTCHIDIETFSKVDLKKQGGYQYAKHRSTEVMCLWYLFKAKGDWESARLFGWIPRADIPPEARPRMDRFEVPSRLYVQEEMPDNLRKHVESGAPLCAWNAQFERNVLKGPAGKRIGFPKVPADQWHCTMAKAAQHALPQDLERASMACPIKHKKDTVGKMSTLKLCKPRKPSKNDPATRWTLESAPGDYRTCYEYCGDDVLAEAALDHYIPDLSPGERRAYLLDQKINDRGIKCDIPAIEDAQFLVDEYKKDLVARCVELTGVKPSQTAKLAEWVRAQGYPIENLQAPTVREVLKDDDCPGKVKRALGIYTAHNMKAVTKLPAMLLAADPDDHRLRGMFQYHAATTGRWSSRIVQLQNLFRSLLVHEYEDGTEEDHAYLAIEQFEMRDLDWIKDFWPMSPMKVIASTIRGMLIPEGGKRLLCLDYGQIEARVIAWLSGQEDVLEAFRQGLDIYKVAAAQIYRVPYDEVTKDQRFVGKVAILSLGYQGGKKAFVSMAKTFDVEMDEDFADQIKTDWRAANHHTVGLWYDMDEAAIAAVKCPGEVFSASKQNILFKVQGDWLYMRLPSGRRLSYYKPVIKENSFGEYVSFMGIDTYTRQWCRTSTYGGKLTENAVQAIARDLLLNAMFNLEEAGYPLIGTVHDEAIMEVGLDKADLEEPTRIMCTLPAWAEGLPVIADGFVDKRYHK